MPWSLIGFGSLFIGALFAWQLAGGGRVALVHTPSSRSAVIAALPGVSTLGVSSRRPATPTFGGDNPRPSRGSTVVIDSSSLQLESETNTWLGDAPAPPANVIVVVQAAPPAIEEPTYGRGVASGIGVGVPHEPVRRVVVRPRPGAITPRSASLPPRAAKPPAPSRAGRPSGGGGLRRPSSGGPGHRLR